MLQHLVRGHVQPLLEGLRRRPIVSPPLLRSLEPRAHMLDENAAALVLHQLGLRRMEQRHGCPLLGLLRRTVRIEACLLLGNLDALLDLGLFFGRDL